MKNSILSASLPLLFTVFSAAQSAPHLGNCPIFPADNIWNTPIDTLPVHAKSDIYLNTIGLDTKLRTDTGTNPAYGIPFAEIADGTPNAKVTIRMAGETDPGPYPIPEDAPVEALGAPLADRHIILIDPHKCILYEIWASQHLGPHEWRIGSGAIWNMNKNDLRKAGWTSADAAGLPIFPFLIRYDEVATGEINHALRFTIPHTQTAYLWPARHMASTNSDPKLPPMGLRLRLRADFDISSYSATNQVILKALKRYGMILADNGQGIFITGSPDKRWDNNDLRKLNQVIGRDFEVIDESALQKSPNSAAVKQP